MCVTIPQGNYDLRKLIIGSYSADETNENLYVNPFNYLVTSSSHEVSDIIITTNTSGNSTSDFKDLEIRFNYSNTINFDLKGFGGAGAGRSFDTGGYTGEWGPEGRLAMLHQKEIVLNAHDTENFLAAIGIVRDISD